MSVLSKGTDWTTGDQVTAALLDALVDSATFVAGATDSLTTTLSGGAIIVKDRGITSAKLDTSISTGTITATTQLIGKGTATNDSAAAGYIGEYKVQTIAVGSAVTPTTGTQADVATITLTAGDWDVGGTITYRLGAGTTVAYTRACTNTTTATIATDNRMFGTNTQLSGSTIDTSFAVPTTRYSVAGSTPIYLVVQSSYAVSTLSVYGSIWARRAR